MSYVISVTVYPSSVTITKGKWYYGAYASIASDCPECAEVEWYSNSPSIASVNKTTGYIYGVNTGTTRIYAEATDGSGKKDYITVTVTAPLSVTGISVCPTSKSMDVGCTDYLYETIYPSNATNQTVTWCSSDDSVAEVNTYSGFVRAKKAGIVTITATTADGGYSDSCEVWVHGKTPVFLIHGRTSNSTDVWGVNNNISSGKNDHLNSDINAQSLNGMKYINVSSQEINSYEPNAGGTETPINLGIHLQNSGYNGNLNLFVFNYPNEDAVKHSAQKFEAYINNMISYVRSYGSNSMKACFYASRSDYNNNKFKINIVGHSMGGLVARYYIENMGYMISYNVGDLVYYEEIGYDKHVDKLITICTPHWGSGYADLSNWTSIEHKLCDHDLDFDSVMFGGNNPNNYKFDENGCKILIDSRKCIDHAYELSNELQYSKSRNTRYYAIAGIDYPGGPIIQNDYWFEMSTNYTTYQQIDNFMVGKQVYRYAPSDLKKKSVGDNMVGFMSQIGWTDNIGNTPNKKIPMEKIFIDVDTNGGNGGGVFVWEVANGLGSEIFHNKAPHRTPVCNKVIEYLED